MLTHLTIENYALIKSLDIDFSSGFTVITGETGAGKSILLGALGLILGQRADSQVLFFKDKKCTVESVFDISDLNLDDFFQLYDLEDSCIDNSLILRREIFPNGKSRAFINDSPVSVSILKEFSVRLIDIHSQHQTLTLTNSAFQLKLVDSYSADAVLIEAYANKYKEYKVLEKEIAVLDGEQKKLQEEEDYLRFVYTELDDLHAQAGEQQEMENNLRILEHGQQIKTTLLSCSEELQANEYSLISRLENTSQNLKKISTYHVGIQTMLPRWEALLVELKDLNTDLEKWGEDLQVDENIRQKYEQRLDLIYRLEAKHHLQTVEELIELKDSISLKLSKISSCDDQLQNLKKQYAIVEKKLKELSSQLHTKRVEAAALLEKQVLSSLLNLGMGSSRLQISIVPTNTYTTTGT
ncbi:MAG: DNA repair protein RecN, partial [Bacteroidales bacterium]